MCWDHVWDHRDDHSGRDHDDRCPKCGHSFKKKFDKNRDHKCDKDHDRKFDRKFDDRFDHKFDKDFDDRFDRKCDDRFDRDHDDDWEWKCFRVAKKRSRRHDKDDHLQVIVHKDKDFKHHRRCSW